MMLKKGRYTLLFSLLIFGVYIFELAFQTKFFLLGIIPRDIGRLYGIMTYPLVHSGAKHLFSNLSVFVPLCFIIELLYPKKIFSVFWMSYIFSGIILWLIGRANVHIGASGFVYAISFFIITHSLITRNKKQFALVFIVLLLNNGIVFGLLPVQEKVSWEGHLSGAVAGVLIGLLLKAESVNVTGDDYSTVSVSDDFEFTYMYKKKEA